MSDVQSQSLQLCEMGTSQGAAGVVDLPQPPEPLSAAEGQGEQWGRRAQPAPAPHNTTRHHGQVLADMKIKTCGPERQRNIK